MGCTIFSAMVREYDNLPMKLELTIPSCFSSSLLDDIFVGVTGQNDISVNDFQEIVQEIQNDPSYRRHFVKANHETSPTSDVADASVSSLPPITIDVRRTHGKRDMMVTEGSELEDNSPQNYSHRLGPTKISENSFEENSAIIEMSSRKTRSKLYCRSSALAVVKNGEK